MSCPVSTRGPEYRADPTTSHCLPIKFGRPDSAFLLSLFVICFFFVELSFNFVTITRLPLTFYLLSCPILNLCPYLLSSKNPHKSCFCWACMCVCVGARGLGAYQGLPCLCFVCNCWTIIKPCISFVKWVFKWNSYFFFWNSKMKTPKYLLGGQPNLILGT